LEFWEVALTTLLAVDDSNTMRKVLEITFAGETDLEVVVAANASEALDRLNQHRPSAAIIDAALSGSDGYSLCEQIKRQAPGTRVLLLSSKQHPYDPSRGTSCGAEDHADKPFDTQSLIDRVRTLLATAPTAAAYQPAPTPMVQDFVGGTAEPRFHEPPPFAAPQPQFQQPQYAEPQYAEPQFQEPQRPHYAAPAFPEVQAPAYQEAQVGGTAEQPAAHTAATVRPRDSEAPTESPPPSNTSTSVTVKGGALTSSAVPQVAAALNGHGALSARLEGLGLTQEQVGAVLALSREVIEQAVWEVVPALAETLIREEIARLTR
jgi:DNA-binding NarL/FixJ family response regulator